MATARMNVYDLPYMAVIMGFKSLEEADVYAVYNNIMKRVEPGYYYTKEEAWARASIKNKEIEREKALREQKRALLEAQRIGARRPTAAAFMAPQINIAAPNRQLSVEQRPRSRGRAEKRVRWADNERKRAQTTAPPPIAPRNIFSQRNPLLQPAYPPRFPLQ